MKNKKKLDARSVRAQATVNERVRSLDDAVFAALDSIADHTGFPVAAVTLLTVLSTFAAKLAWHDTEVTEEEFLTTARQCFRQIAQAHAGCPRGEHVEHEAEREDLN